MIINGFEKTKFEINLMENETPPPRPPPFKANILSFQFFLLLPLL